ncbi:flagellar biosynthesis protein FlhF [Anaerosporobacter faecicola]|uniref:flagellar biosynthesis protein FlhF n=1 Tax=Anaerosporobacter faecicola TaxID=2718714 RepID=UPI00143C6286|nr:flagellar biosynthesis protein FlhF [Anaerosporobacter faecicola]
MIIKKFQAETEKEAILLAKEELGKDAIVTNIKTIKPKGIYKFFKPSKVEITAAVDDTVNYEEDSLLSSFQKLISENQNAAQGEGKGSTFDVKVAEEKRESDNTLFEDVKSTYSSAIEKRLDNLQNLIEKQIKPTVQPEEEKKEEIDSSSDNEYIKLIYKQMLLNEVDEKFANKIISEIESTLQKGAPVDNILTSIYQKIVLKLGQPETIELGEQKPKFVFFIGPTGVGKTTTIAKIASGFKMNKNTKMALVTSDTYRIAAVEQLRIYANILGVPLKVIYSAEELMQSKEEFNDYDIVLIDTAGRSHKNTEQKDDLESLLNTIDDSMKEIYLVLSATTKYKDLVRITETYSTIANYRIIFTKLDETICMGNILNVRMMTGAPLSYAAWGQNVPNDIGRLDAQFVAKKLLGGSD